MSSPPDGLIDGPDAEENLFVPAGYTYLGQFIDHDLTLDLTSTLSPDDLQDPSKPLNDPSNQRSPRFDLDCVYGTGPGDEPFMYATSAQEAPGNGIYGGATLLDGGDDLLRSPGNQRAIIGDKRNDENSIVNQIQHAFIRFHNRVVARLAGQDPGLRGDALFKAARNEVRWAYQRILVEDFLPRIIDHRVLDSFRQRRAQQGVAAYQLFKPALRSNLPREFVAAAYRYGHSGVRTGYRLNGTAGAGTGHSFNIFLSGDQQNANDPAASLIGFDPLPATHLIDDWGRFFPAFANGFPQPNVRAVSNVPIDPAQAEDDGRVRLQYAYKIDPSLVDPLAHLPTKIAGGAAQAPGLPGTVASANPSLGLLNLLRGNRYQLPSGQAIAAKIGVPALDAKYLCYRESTERTMPDGTTQNKYRFVGVDTLAVQGDPIGNVFLNDTPLWFYILAEAQAPLVDVWLRPAVQGSAFPFLSEDDLLGKTEFTASELAQGYVQGQAAATRLQWVGGTIVAEVFYGLLDSDDESIHGPKVPAGWKPIWNDVDGLGNDPATFTRLLRFAGLTI
jgi:hypothetical protein